MNLTFARVMIILASTILASQPYHARAADNDIILGSWKSPTQTGSLTIHIMQGATNPDGSIKGNFHLVTFDNQSGGASVITGKYLYSDGGNGFASFILMNETEQKLPDGKISATFQGANNMTLTNSISLQYTRVSKRPS